MASPTPEQWESRIDRQIREAQERGEFDDLPGRGRPLPSIDQAHDPDWWIKGLIAREQLDASAALPPALLLRREVENLMTTLARLRDEAKVREVVDDLNRRILDHRRRATEGPVMFVRTVDADDAVARWRDAVP